MICGDIHVHAFQNFRIFKKVIKEFGRKKDEATACILASVDCILHEAMLEMRASKGEVCIAVQWPGVETKRVDWAVEKVKTIDTTIAIEKMRNGKQG